MAPPGSFLDSVRWGRQVSIGTAGLEEKAEAYRFDVGALVGAGLALLCRRSRQSCKAHENGNIDTTRPPLRKYQMLRMFMRARPRHWKATGRSQRRCGKKKPRAPERGKRGRGLAGQPDLGQRFRHDPRGFG